MRYVLSGLGALLLSSSVVFAGTVTEYSPTYNQSAFDVTGNLTIDLPAFNPMLGTLNSATVVFEGITQPQLEVFNFGSAAGIGVGSEVVNYTLSGNGANLFVSESSGTQSVSVPGGFGNIDSSPAGSPMFFDSTQTLSAPTGLTGAGDLTFSLNELFTSSGSVSSTTPTAVLGFGGTASSNFGLQITYDYTAVDPSAVPEPMTLAIVSVGLIGLGMARRKRA